MPNGVHKTMLLQDKRKLPPYPREYSSIPINLSYAITEAGCFTDPLHVLRLAKRICVAQGIIRIVPWNCWYQWKLSFNGVDPLVHACLAPLHKHPSGTNWDREWSQAPGKCPLGRLWAVRLCPADALASSKFHKTQCAMWPEGMGLPDLVADLIKNWLTKREVTSTSLGVPKSWPGEVPSQHKHWICPKAAGEVDSMQVHGGSKGYDWLIDWICIPPIFPERQLRQLEPSIPHARSRSFLLHSWDMAGARRCFT